MIRSARPTSLFDRLAGVYKKPPIRLILGKGRTASGPDRITAELPPVMYYGTLTLIEKAVRNCCLKTDISFSWDPAEVRPYAEWVLAELDQKKGLVWVVNNEGKAYGFTDAQAFNAVEAWRLGSYNEFRRMTDGDVRNSILMFDRDTLLGAQHDALVKRYSNQRVITGMPRLVLEWETEGWLIDPRKPIATPALIACLHRSNSTGITDFRVHNTRLWEENFAVKAPQLRKVFFSSMEEAVRHWVNMLEERSDGRTMVMAER